MREINLKRWLAAGACAAALAVPVLSHAAGLGRLTVLSSLGQPLNAEVELLSVQKGETLTARLSSVDSYQRANLPYNAALVGARVTVERRSNGTPYIKVTTARPVNEPFAELLIEINSENGRVIRQFTVLLDPPGYGRAAGELPPPIAAPVTRSPAASAEAPAPAAAAPSAPVEGAPGGAAAPAPSAAPSAPAAAARQRRAPRAAAQPAQAPSAGGRTYGPIKRGETLGTIAKSLQPEGVTLEQTLVGLYRSNPDAFIRKNMNLVKSGRILTVPEASEMSAVAQREAVKEVRLQVADFNSFGSRLAERAGAAPEDGSTASGRIGTRVSKGPAAEPRDTVRLSRGDKGAKGAAAERVRALEEESVAREKALADANARIEQLEKTIDNMKRLAEMKGAAPAQPAAAPAAKGQVPGPVAVAPVIPAPAKVPEPMKGSAPGTGTDSMKGSGPGTGAEPVKGSSPGTGAEPVKGSGPGTDPVKGAGTEPSKVDESGKGSGAVATGPEGKSDLPPPKAKAKPVPVTTAEPDFIDTLLDEPLYLVAGGGVVVLGALAFVAARRRRESVKAAPMLGPEPTSRVDAEPHASRTPPPAPAAPSLQPAPVRATASVPVPPARAADDNDLDFNAGIGSSGASRAVEPPQRVEPVTRADAAVPSKASAPRAEPKPASSPAPARGTPLDFEQAPGSPSVSRKSATAPAEPPLSSKSAEARAEAPLSPKSAEARAEAPLSSKSAEARAEPPLPTKSAATPAEPPLSFKSSAPAPAEPPIPAKTLDTPPEQPPARPIAAEPAPVEYKAPARPKRAPAPSSEIAARAPSTAPKTATPDLDAMRSFESAAPAEPKPPQPPSTDKADSLLDLPDFSLEVPPAGSNSGNTARPTAAASDFNMDFNLEPLPPIEVPGDAKSATPAAAPEPAQAQSQSNDLEFKLDDISLDFGSAKPAGAMGRAQKDDHWYDVQQKFDLAKAYEEMGDKDGARDILREVMKEGDVEQQTQAKKLLGTLG